MKVTTKQLLGGYDVDHIYFFPGWYKDRIAGVYNQKPLRHTSPGHILRIIVHSRSVGRIHNNFPTYCQARENPNRVYSVATTDYIALGDTGYPDLIDSSVPRLPRPLYTKRKLQSLSSLVCNQLKKAPAGDSIVCSPDFKGQGYFDELEVAGPTQLPGNTWQEGWKTWVRSLKSNGKQGSDLESWAQEKIPTWRFSLDKTNLGFTVQRHSDTQADLNNTFGGVSNSQATAARSHTWNLDQEMSYTYNHPL